MGITSVRIREELDIPLQELAKKEQRSKSWLINKALEEYLKREEIESKKWLDTLEGLESIRKGEVVDGEEVHAWMESWGTENELDPPKI